MAEAKRGKEVLTESLKGVLKPGNFFSVLTEKFARLSGAPQLY
jgi:hypothetical protein